MGAIGGVSRTEHASVAAVAAYTRRTLGPWQMVRFAALALVLLCAAACAPTGRVTGTEVQPPQLPAPHLLAIGDVGRATQSRVVQMGADTTSGRAIILAGHMILAPVTSAPWADHLVGLDRDTGATVWQFAAADAPVFKPNAHLSGMVVDRARHEVVIAGGSHALALDDATGAVKETVLLPPGIDCGSFPAPTVRPVLHPDGRILFPCHDTSATDFQQTGVLVDLAAGTASLTAPPPVVTTPPPPAIGILGHTYTVSVYGLRVSAQGSSPNTPPIAELPFNVESPASALLVETDATGAPTGRLYLAGIGAQVAILQDDSPGALSSQTGALWATVLAERAVALTVAPARFRDGTTLPTLPGFLVTSGDLARTACYGEAAPFAPGTATATTGVSPTAGRAFQVDLRLSTRDVQGKSNGSRRWIVTVVPNHLATIVTDTGHIDPFNPLPPVPCPV